MADKYLNKTVLEYFYNRLKTVFITSSDIPSNLSDFTNDEGFIDNTVSNLVNYYVKDNTYTKTEVDNLISGITGVNFEIVQSLPTTGNVGTIYLLSNSGTSPNVYDEYIYVNNSWEKIGSTDIDLSQYWAKSELTAITTAEIDTIVDGE